MSTINFRVNAAKIIFVEIYATAWTPETHWQQTGIKIAVLTHPASTSIAELTPLAVKVLKQIGLNRVLVRK